MKTMIVLMILQFGWLFSSFHAPVRIQENPQELSKTQQEQLRKYMTDLDQKLIAVWNKNPKEKATMEAELKSIEAIKDKTKFQEAIKGYKAKYASIQRRVLKEAGILPDLVKKDLQNILKGYTIDVNDLMEVTATMQQKTASIAKSKPTTTQKTVLRYNFSKDLNCSLIAGASASSTTTSLLVSGFAAVAGGCSAKGELNQQGTFPAGSATQMNSKMTMETYASAMGVLGSALSTVHTSYSTVFYNQERGNVLLNIREGFFVGAIAPILWFHQVNPSNEVNRKDDISNRATFGQSKIYISGESIGVVSPYTLFDAKVTGINNFRQ